METFPASDPIAVSVPIRMLDAPSLPSPQVGEGNSVLSP